MSLETFPTLSVNPDFPIITTPIWDTHIVRGEKLEQRESYRNNCLLHFRFSYRYITDADRKLIEDFFDARKGSYEKFTWVNPETNLSYTVRFATDRLSKIYPIYNSWDIPDIELIEAVLTDRSSLVSRVTVTS